ncbi:hypothetical protein [Shimia ponticola]|uniref:hypothetical protein n=1 Tax=Shimia ponticola TaxID=2582893 RepID=UPI0011BD697F|nr:hypothetical protein [Shimia ponticola]
MAKGYVAFKNLARDQWVSADEYKNHEAAAEWVSRALAHLGMAASDIAGKPAYPLNDQPNGATVLDV